MAIVVAVCVTTIILPLCALSVDISRMFLEAERVQSAADAAATAGVTYLPDNFAGAQAAARAAAARNGFDGVNGSQVVVEAGAKPTQLKVTVTTAWRNAFAGAFGMGDATVSRSSVADYNGPAPMGSPCNTFGNEPAGTDAAGPIGSQISVPPGGATCSSSPNFFAAIAGPGTSKISGDQYMSRRCQGGESGCTGTVNTEYHPAGHFYTIHASEAARGSTVSLQVFDPAFVEVGDLCERTPSGTVDADDWNDWANRDARSRYAKNPGAFCTGDVLIDQASTEPIVTSYGVRSPTEAYDPLRAAPVVGCGKQFPGYLKSSVTAAALKRGNAAYNAPLARVFRQWVTICTFTITQPGDYFLQVRTNVAAGTAALGADGARTTDAVVTQTGDDTSVNAVGNNRYGVRVVGAPAGSTSVAGLQSMAMYMNYSGAAAEFNLVRVVPAAQTKQLVLSFFDVGDTQGSPGEITIVPPPDSNLSSPITSCRGTGVVNGSIANCTLTNVSSSNGYNGKVQQITIPIPSGYTCSVAQAGGCWFKVRFAFPSSAPTDNTTWTAQITGDPVRIIE